MLNDEEVLDFQAVIFDVDVDVFILNVLIDAGNGSFSEIVG